MATVGRRSLGPNETKTILLEFLLINNYSPKAKWIREDYPTLFAEPEENNCFSNAQVIIRTKAFSFLQKHQKSCGGHFEN